MMDDEELKYWIALKAVEDVGCVGFKALLAAFSSPRAVFSAPARMLQAVPGIGPKTADHIRSFSDWAMAEEEIPRAREARCRHRHLRGSPVSAESPEHL